MSKGNGSSNGLDAFELEFVNGVAKSLRENDIDTLAEKLGFEDSQRLADHYGFKNIFVFFSAPGNTERYGEIESELRSGKRKESHTTSTP